jgi:hypothetical protein
MIVLLNIILALLAGYITLWLCGELRMPHPVAVLAALGAVVLVFLANLADTLLR